MWMLISSEDIMLLKDKLAIETMEKLRGKDTEVRKRNLSTRRGNEDL